MNASSNSLNPAAAGLLWDWDLPVLVINGDGQILDFSQPAEELLAGEEESLKKKPIQHLQAGEYPFELLDQLQTLPMGSRRKLKVRFRTRSGDVSTFRVIARKIVSQDQPQYILTLIDQSVTEQLKKEVIRLKEELRLAYLRIDQMAGEQESSAEQSQFEVSVLHQIGQTLLTTIDLEKVLFIVLTCVTAHPAFGFSRAFLLSVNEEKQTLEGTMGVGPRSVEEAYRIWQGLSDSKWGLEEFLAQYDQLYSDGQLPLDSVIKRYEQPLERGRDVLVDAALTGEPIQVHNAMEDNRVSPECMEVLACNHFVVVPLVAEGKAMGVIVADNMYKDRAITPRDVRLLTLFANHSAMALHNAATHSKLRYNMNRVQEYQQQLIQAERLTAIGQMTARVAHEIRNPLVTIGGFARSVLKSLPPDSMQARKCEIIVEETMRLEEILGSLLDFSRQRELQLEHCRIDELIGRASLLLREELQAGRIQVCRETDEDLPDLLLDIGKISQVLINLIKNAIQAMKDGGTVTISAHRQGRFVSIKVADTGEGIPIDIQGNVFNPFFTTKSEGFGLGLAISRSYIYDHGGNISVHSQLGQGSTFEILLPLPAVRIEAKAVHPQLESSPSGGIG